MESKKQSKRTKEREREGGREGRKTRKDTGSSLKEIPLTKLEIISASKQMIVMDYNLLNKIRNYEAILM